MIQPDLLQLIDQAFQGVELGDGVSLHETVVLDDYGSKARRQAARKLDEKHDWRKLINDPELIRPSFDGISEGGLSYYDAAGFRFYLPAYLSLIVSKPDTEGVERVAADLLIHLTHFITSDHIQHQLALLNATQKACVREALKFLRDRYNSPENGPLLWDLDLAMEGFWAPMHRGV